MDIKTAFTNISSRKYLQRCKYTYEGLHHFKNMDFEDLPYSMQLGIIEMIWSLYRIQKMVYIYDLEYVNRCLSDCGVKLRPFYKSCNINKTFWMTRSIIVDRNYRLMKIRMEIMKMVNRLLLYTIKKPSTKGGL